MIDRELLTTDFTDYTEEEFFNRRWTGWTQMNVMKIYVRFVGFAGGKILIKKSVYSV